MTEDPDRTKTTETYSTNPPYADERGLKAADQRRWWAWTVLAAGAAVLIIAGVSVAIWPDPDNNDPTATASTKPDPINTQPSGPGTFNDDPASGPARPPEATDRSPAPSGNGGGPTGVTTPSGTEKVQ
ncbi:hypothetical protein N2597_04690 [Rhizobium sophoriradicis]|uniref:Uncharacterized protein n=1 Tax=Rhizobium etli bv. mimosae str. IE4771 TaxID=1432050 RepID=A0A060HXY9_RHIET|nr:hypothetical protein [Rhizobium sp. IE4771]AIC26452.1 hypothetical protein IE4771_CH01304 [Rhizobium sp. IE4771]UWU35612.1 hypothetical protein N2597_04690 [Rhizobium leguminosarum bv. phaseoli]